MGETSVFRRYPLDVGFDTFKISCKSGFLKQSLLQMTATLPKRLLGNSLLLTFSASEKSTSSTTCEGGVDVVGVVTPLGGVPQVIFHGVKVVEVGVVLRVHQDRGEEEDGEGQVEVERGGR